jgi:type IV pilus assembly protein PilE
MIKSRAFTLLELIIAIVIVAILAIIAVASYRHYILMSNRSDAIQTLQAIQLAEENYRSTNTSYGTLAQVWGGASATEQGNYSLAITNISATSYTITASATGSQAQDTTCASIVLAHSSGTTTRTPATCWGED